MKAKTGMKKRVASLVLAIVLCCGTAFMLPVQANAVIMQNGKPAITVYTTEIGFAGHTWVVVGDLNTGVKTTDADHVTLLLKNGDAGFTGFTSSVYNSTGFNNYIGSDIQKAMQGANADGGIYKAIGDANSLEQGMIESRELSGVTVDNIGTPGTVAGQYVWPLSFGEVSTIYMATRSGSESVLLKYGNSWWMRSYNGITNVDSFNPNGVLPPVGTIITGYADQFNSAIRPALILNLDSALFTSVASGTGAKYSENADADLAQVPDPLSLETTIKFTMPDSSMVLSSATATAVSGSTITFEYAITGSNHNRLSAVVKAQDGTVTHYGNLKANPGPSGTGVTVTIPSGLAATDKLYIFAEQANDANITDFASALVEMSFATQTAPAGLAGTRCSTAANDDGHITGTTAAMEYSADGGSTWTPCTASPTTGLAPGTYQVRYAAYMNGTQPVIAGPAEPVTITAFSASQPQQQQDSPTDPGPGSPLTGDSSNLPLWALCGGAALVGLALCGIVLRWRFGRKAG